jgi:hypothetical protein
MVLSRQFFRGLAGQVLGLAQFDQNQENPSWHSLQGLDQEA